jgi:hypothetical protein
VLKAVGELAVMESTYPAGLSVHEHVHTGEDEMFYVLAGELLVFCRQDRWTATAAASSSCRATARTASPSPVKSRPGRSSSPGHRSSTGK